MLFITKIELNLVFFHVYFNNMSDLF